MYATFCWHVKQILHGFQWKTQTKPVISQGVLLTRKIQFQHQSDIMDFETRSKQNISTPATAYLIYLDPEHYTYSHNNLMNEK